MGLGFSGRIGKIKRERDSSMKAREKDVFIIDEAEKSLKELNRIVGEQVKKGIKNSFEMQLLNSIKQKIGWIKENPFYGNQIEKKKIPKSLMQKYKTNNLWRVELNNFWRMIYMIKGSEIEIICFILEICDHKKYNKLFGYKRK